MPRPLAHCIARPDEDDRHFPLIEHLIAVACGCGRGDGYPEDRLAFLAGLMHDAAKTDREWQHYIRNLATVRKGPPHAPLGSALFAFWADDLIPRWATGDRAEQQRLFDLALDWTRLVYDHHGALKDLALNDAPWSEAGSEGYVEDPAVQLTRCDQGGITALVKLFFPECVADLSGFATWLNTFNQRWHRRVQVERTDLLHKLKRARQQAGADVPLAPEGLRLARIGARLIFADRSHAADWDVSHLEPAEAKRATIDLERFCAVRAIETQDEGADPDLIIARTEVRQAAVKAYCRQPDAPAYTLLLPTGYGKTLTGLRVALEACRSGRCRRIIYVAPYLSILSQAADEIRKASGLEVFVHHHLTIAELDDHNPYDVLETWQAPVLATTFNQLFRALFPRRAQQCLRIPALDQAFLLIDEPQIVDMQVWNLFLRSLAVVLGERRGQALLSTATLPPPSDGLGFYPVALAAANRVGGRAADRYRIHSPVDPWTIAETAKQARSRLASVGSVATILNTVRDAVQVYTEAAQGTTDRWFFLAAMMLPGHKAARIQLVRDRLKLGRAGGPAPTGVVCTQVLEAGVDLSFRSVLRAVPIYSSIAQAAGRANRHGEGKTPAEVVAFPFRRDDGSDSRRFVYRDETARRHTDGTLRDFPDLPEGRVAEALDEYYRRCWAENPVTACLQQFESAALGRWSEIAGLGPFSESVPEVEVFVPGSERYLIPQMRPLLDRLGVSDAADLLRRYRDPAFRRRLGFLDRKRLSAALRQFTVGVPERVAKQIAQQSTEHDWLWVLDDPSSYNDDTGLAHLLGPAEDDLSFLMI